MTSYKLDGFTMADGRALIGKTADITEWDDDQLETTVTYPTAQVTGIIGHIGPYLRIKTAGALMADARTGAHLGSRPPEPELRIGFTGICEVNNVRDRAAPATDAPPETRPAYERGDRIALEHTTDPHTRLQPGDQGTVTGYDPRLSQLNVRWDSGSTLAMLLADGDQVRLITPVPKHPGPACDDPDLAQAAAAYLGAASEEFWREAARLTRRRRQAASPATAAEGGNRRQDITDPATGLSRLLSERCSTCILRHGDKMHLGAEYTAAFVAQALDADSYVVCHQTLTYGDHPGFGPAICRGFFDAFASRSPALRLLRAFSRLTEVEPPGPQADAR